MKFRAFDSPEISGKKTLYILSDLQIEQLYFNVYEEVSEGQLSVIFMKIFDVFHRPPTNRFPAFAPDAYSIKSNRIPHRR